MSTQYGSLRGNSMGLSARPLSSVADCERRLKLLREDRAREVKPGEPWKYDGAIEHAKRELAAAIEREQPAAK